VPDQPEVPEPSETGTDPETDQNDDLRSRFRAALDRKRAEAHARSLQGHGASAPKVHEHGRAGGKRTFRRKSG
jgi:hypothetical protein